MPKTTITVIEPDFYKDFRCAAAGCRNNCCAIPWSITVDKQAYKKLRALRKPEWLAREFGKYYKRLPDSASSQAYAQIVHGQGGCAFQTAEGLCRIHAELGPEYLSVVCQEYPRLAVLLPGRVLERSLTASCEEVVRLLLEHREPICYSSDTVTASDQANDPCYRHAEILSGTKEDPVRLHYSLVQGCCIAILQDRRYRVEDRIKLLLLFLDKLAEAQRDRSPHRVPGLVADFAQSVAERLWDPVLAQKPEAEILTGYANLSWIYFFKTKENNPYLESCKRGLDRESYGQMGERCRAFLAGREYFLENLLVNELVCKQLPFYRKFSVWAAAQYLASAFVVYRFALGALLADRETLTDTELIDFTALFGKTVFHSLNGFDTCLALLQKNELGDLPHLLAVVSG